jgi:hypothetical protein
MVWTGSAYTAIQEALDGTRLEGERAKLERSGKPERHLFAWIMPTQFAAHVGLASEEVAADAAPVLPQEVTTLWIGAESHQGFVVWRSHGDPWERLVVPSEGFRHE